MSFSPRRLRVRLLYFLWWQLKIIYCVFFILIVSVFFLVQVYTLSRSDWRLYSAMCMSLLEHKSAMSSANRQISEFCMALVTSLMNRVKSIQK